MTISTDPGTLTARRSRKQLCAVDVHQMLHLEWVQMQVLGQTAIPIGWGKLNDRE